MDVMEVQLKLNDYTTSTFKHMKVIFSTLVKALSSETSVHKIKLGLLLKALTSPCHIQPWWLVEHTVIATV